MFRRDAQAAGLFAVLLALFTHPIVLWPRDLSFVSVIGNMLYGLLAAAIASEMTETILALAWPRRAIPRATGEPARSQTAIVMTVCDDWTEAHLSRLSPLADAGYDLFLLDDSTSPARVPAGLPVTHLRRTTRAGAKAGNLNHWLREHGDRYRQLILLDADSTLSVEAADALVLSAAHPANAEIAIFQAKIESAPRRPSLLATVLGAGARPRMRVMERVHAPLELLLSFGHNQLVRLAPLRALGGFDEMISNEDTAMSLELASCGWKIALVDVWTYDEDPATITAYSRRIVRWTMQTIETFRRDWRAAPLRLKLLLCRHLLLNALPVIGTALLALSLWTAPVRMHDSLSLLRAYATTIATLSASAVAWLVLRIVLARIEGVSWRTLGISWLFGAALLPVIVLPVAVAMLRMLFGHHVRFVPTNSRIALIGDASMQRRMQQALSICAVLLIVIGAVVRRPGGLLIGTNWLWCALLVFSPVSLFLMTRRGAS